MADNDTLKYEAPILTVLGTLEELTEGLPVTSGPDLALFYRGF